MRKGPTPHDETRMSLDLDTALAALRTETGWLAEGESAYVPHYWNLHHAEQPRAVRSPDEYDGGPDLAIWCTQLDVPASQQRKLVAHWVQTLPTLQGVRRLWFTSRVSQELFDAACRIEGLTDLRIKWSGIKTLDAVTPLTGLRRFHLGDSASLQSLQPLAALRQLEWLWLDGLSKVPDLEPLAGLGALEGLFVAGTDSKPLVVPTLAPLSALRQLRWLQLGCLRPAAGGVEPLGRLSALEYIGLPNDATTEEFARLSARLPRAAGSWMQPYARQHPANFRCTKCRERGQVFTAGAPMRRLCPACDAPALARHMVRFHAARDAELAAVAASGP
jgi:hypothetical protein